ncbi:helix-turn-helix transcriptional regulator [Isoptericola sp. F-RaC21]|uniref:helix-turn-helix domain-containing protein n=1 Tax=Isoptericola sp. F-RaC21 TaxID=3141452 RepID=UPI00315B5C62
MSTRRWFRARTPEALGTALRRAREVSGLSQEMLAQQAETSRPTVSRAERGSSIASGTVIDLATACGYEIVLVPRGARVTVASTDGAPA